MSLPQTVNSSEIPSWAYIRNGVFDDDQPEINQLDREFNLVMELLDEDKFSDLKDNAEEFIDKVEFDCILYYCSTLLSYKFIAAGHKDKRSFDDMDLDDKSVSDQEADKNDLTISDIKRERWVSHNQLVRIFWKYCDTKIDKVLEKLLSDSFRDVLNKVRSYREYDVLVIDYWNTVLEIFELLMRILYPMIQYVFRNYPDIFKKCAPEDSTFTGYLYRKFFHAFKDMIIGKGTTFGKYITNIMDTQRKNQDKFASYRFPVSPMRFTYLYSETIDGMPILDYCFKEVDKAMSGFSLKIMMMHDFARALFKATQTEILLGYAFSPEYMELIKMHIVNNIYKSKKAFSEYFHFWSIERPRAARLWYNDYYPIQPFILALTSTGSATDKDTKEFKNLTTELILEDLQSIKDDPKNNPDDLLFYKVRVHSSFFLSGKRKYPSRCDIHPFYFPDEITGRLFYKCFKKAYVEYCGSELILMKKVVSHIMKIIANPEPKRVCSCDNTYDGPLREMLTVLAISPKIIELLSGALLKRAILEGKDFIDLLQGDGYIGLNIDKIFETLKLVYKDPAEGIIEMKNNLKHVGMVIKEWKNFKNCHIDLVPMVLPKNVLPETFIKYGIHHRSEFKLPNELKDTWDIFEKSYKETLHKSEYKQITPLYEFQHCEVETPYILENGNPLIFILSLFQTCVLNEFNNLDGNTTGLLFDDLMEKLQMDSTDLENVLTSFLYVKLLKINKGDQSFVLNDQFIPDETKVKNGKLKIPLIPKRLPNIFHSSSSTISRKSSTLSISSSTDHMEGLSGVHHPEGLSSIWMRELIRACIVRTLKSRHNDKPGLSERDLFQECSPQLYGVSMGEFKSALQSATKERYVTLCDDKTYVYSM